jgi:3-oxoadipate enol-lactonase
VPSPTGLPAHEVSGDGDVTIVMLHGAYGDGRYFANTRDVLVAEGYRVVVWDCPGYAGTPLPEDSSIESHARAAADLIAVVLGHSMGGLIAPLATLLAGDRVEALVLSASSAGFATKTPEEQKQFLAERVDPIEDGLSVAEYAPGLLSTMMGPGASGPLVDTVVQVVCEMRTETFKASMAAISAYDGTDALRRQTVPTLLIAGQYDTACPPDGMKLMADLVPDSEYHEIEGVGHYAFAERPEVYHRILLDFLQSHLLS